MPRSKAPAALLGRRVLVIGLRRTGLSVARYLAGAGVGVRACDRSADVELPVQLEESVELVRGTDGPELLDGVDLVVPSPGVPAGAPILVAARRKSIPVVSEIELAAAVLEAPIVAITGTNGKSTTTSLTGAMLEQAGMRVFTGGNLGTPLIDAAGGSFDVVVAEVSSFQLEWVAGFHPHVGVLLNVSDDHLDRYADRSEYLRTKARIFRCQTARDVAILNRDDPEVFALAPNLDAEVRSFGRAGRPGTGNGRWVGHGSATLEGETVVLDEPEGRFVLSLARTRLAGLHNRENIMAALLAARAMGAPPAHLQSAIDGFSGLRHRLELVREVKGVSFVDDSKGTNVGALLKSLEGFSDGSVVLIAGGLAKGGDYAVARDALTRKVRQLVLYGEARAHLEASWDGSTEISGFVGFADAVDHAIGIAQPGDVVLLSPACASQDQFTDYAARGDAFAARVKAIPA